MLGSLLSFVPYWFSSVALIQKLQESLVEYQFLPGKVQVHCWSQRIPQPMYDLFSS